MKTHLNLHYCSANLADDKLIILFPQEIDLETSCKLSPNNLHEIAKPIFLGKSRKKKQLSKFSFSMLSVKRIDLSVATKKISLISMYFPLFSLRATCKGNKPLDSTDSLLYTDFGYNDKIR